MSEPSPTVRPVTPADLPLLERIEHDADTAFVERFGATDWPAATPGEVRAADPGFILVAEVDGATVGFAHVLEPAPEAADATDLPPLAHLEQLAVEPAAGRRGIGTLLLADAARIAGARGAELVTLRTYDDVPWNGPFYRARGYSNFVADRAFLSCLPAAEHAEGIDAYGERVLLGRALSRPWG